MMKRSLSAGTVAKRIFTCFATALRRPRAHQKPNPPPPAVSSLTGGGVGGSRPAGETSGAETSETRFRNPPPPPAHPPALRAADERGRLAFRAALRSFTERERDGGFMRTERPPPPQPASLVDTATQATVRRDGEDEVLQVLGSILKYTYQTAVLSFSDSHYGIGGGQQQYSDAG